MGFAVGLVSSYDVLLPLGYVFARADRSGRLLFTKLKVQEYLWKKYLDQEPAEEEPAPEPVVDLNELD